MLIFTAAIAASPLADLTKFVVGHFPQVDKMASNMEILYNKQAAALSNISNWQEYIIGLFIMAFFPAMFEEVFFRGTVQNLFTKWWRNPLLAIIVTSLIFSLIHMSIYLFLSRILLGFVLGLMYHQTKNIWVNIVAHFINNGIVLTSIFALRIRNQKVDLDKLDPSVHWSLGLVGIIALVGLFLMLNKYSAKNRARIEAKENLLIAEANPYNSITQQQTN